MKTLLTLILLAGCLLVHAQERLTLTNPRFHSYSPEELPDELYRFADDALIQGLIDTIVARTNHEREFVALAANVPAVTAVLADEGAFLLYNQVLLNYQIDENSRIALLAQGIGHLIQDHRLVPQRRAAEVLEADVYVGFTLFRMGVPEPFLSVVPVLMSQQNTPSWRDRRAALEAGFRRAKYSIIIQPGSAFQSGDGNDRLPGLSEFPFPPPSPSASYPISDYFSTDGKLAQVDRRLRSALEANGYYEHHYFYVKNGFALVTAIEQFDHPSGTSKSEPGRWAERPARQENFSLLEYLSALLKANPAYYRLFVFIVTDQYVAPNPDEEVSLAVANKWLSHGAVSLPPAIGELPLGTNHQIYALVYEFIKHEDDNAVEQVERSQIQGRIHLQRSGIITNFKRD
ncbi:MAG: hypothetical protein AAFP77_23755 [Bacteroidota bacterium]